MAANIPANLDLTLEQDTYLRLSLLGWILRSANPETDRYQTSEDYGRVLRERQEDGTTLIQPEPLQTTQITWSFDPVLLSRAFVCGTPLYEAVTEFPAGEELGCSLGSGDGQLVDPQFLLVALVDDSDTVVIDDNDQYPIEA